MTLQKTLEEFGKKLDTLPDVTVRHYTRGGAKAPFLVWQEDGTDDFCADDGHSQGIVTGSADYYTKLEFDPKVEEISALLAEHADAWELVAVEHEEDTDLIHFSWDWELCYG